MTKNNMDKHIQNSMLDDLLSDKDKTSRPKGGGMGGTSSYDPYNWDDDGPDPLDDGYNGYSKRGKYTPPPRKTTYTPVPKYSYQPAQIRKFDVDETVEDIVNKGEYSRETGHIIITRAQAERIATIYMRKLGLFNDNNSLCWTSGGSIVMRDTILGLFNGEMFYSGMRVVIKEDDEEAGTNV